MSDEYDYDDDDDDDRRAILPWIVRGIVVVALLVGGWFAYRAFSKDDTSDGTEVQAGSTTALDSSGTAITSSQPATTGAGAGGATSTDATSADATVTSPESDATSSTAPADDAATTIAVAPTAATVTATTTVVTDSAAPPTTAAAVETTDAPPTTAPGVSETLPDGSYAPVLAVFDVDTITLWGLVPSQEAANRLSALALANSKTPATIENLMTIDPKVPIGIGVRVIELNSVRFPAGSAEVLPPHAEELNRIAAIMNALPNITTLVVGHADQVGTEQANFELSEARARSVVSYLVSQGIQPSRLSSRAVGEDDLLRLGDDATSLALNRRTEFIIYGLLIE